MKKFALNLLLAVAAGVSAFGWTVPAASVAPEADGVLRSGEWDGAAEQELPGGGRLLIKGVEGRVWLAIVPAATHATYVDVFLQGADGVVHNLHASLQWGERIVSGDAWTDQEPPTTWGRPARWGANRSAWAPGGREAKEVTRASFVPYEAHEFWIARASFPGAKWKVRIEVRDFAGQAGDVVVPAQSSRFQPAGWLELRLE